MAASSSDGSVQQARLNSSRYCKTKIPILSKDFRRLVSQVKSKKLQVEEKEAEISRLKADFQNLGINKKDEELPSLVLGTTSSSSSVSTATPTLRDHSSGRIRTVIRTPGGSKRKGINLRTLFMFGFHLRREVSLQKKARTRTKKKQDEMWDFTVRGWRACDITDIEDFFEDQDTAKKPQRNVADLKFEDLSIGKV